MIGFDLHNHLVDLIQDIHHLCTLSMIDRITATSGGISGGKQMIKFANTIIAVEFAYSLKNETTIRSCKMYSSSFDMFYVIFACRCEDIYGGYCIQKSNNDHFHL